MRISLASLLFRSRPAAFSTPAPREEALERLRRVTRAGTPGSWPATPGLAGHVGDDYVYLTRQTTLASGGFRMQFIGRLADAPEGTVLAGRFVPPLAASIVFVAALGASAAWAIGALYAALAGGGSREAPLLAGAVFAAVLLARLVSGHLARYDEARIGAWIERALADASPPETTR